MGVLKAASLISSGSVNGRDPTTNWVPAVFISILLRMLTSFAVTIRVAVMLEAIEGKKMPKQFVRGLQ